MMRSFVVISLCLFLSFSSVSSQFCIQGGVRPDCNSVSLGLEAVWNSTSCRFECPTECPATTSNDKPFPFRDCQTSGCSTMRCMAGTTCRNDRCVTGSNKCSGQCVPDATPPPVNCIINPCDNAVRDGLCTREACVADYSIGCNFICNTNTTTKPTTAPSTTAPTSTPAPVCAKSCGTCDKGTECSADQNGCMKCQAVPTTTAPNCADACKVPEELNECEYGCQLLLDKCTYKCREMPRVGETVRTILFELSVEFRRPTTDIDTVVYLADAMREIADTANIPRSDYIINNDDIVRISGRKNSRMGDWQIKIGFRAIQHPDGDRRKEFIRQLIKSLTPDAKTYDATDSNLAGLLIQETTTVTEAKEFYESQTCQDGRTISADKQCAAVTSAATTSTSSSTPIVAIIAPIIGGIVLVAIIATAFIIRRRRADTVKTIENIARDTAHMETNPAIAAVQSAEGEGADRV